MNRYAIAVIVALASSSGAADAGQARGGGAAGTCDRACLTGIADAYFAALAAHDPARAPLAPAARSTENAQEVRIGEGLWKTTTEAPAAFKIYVPDPVSGQVGGLVAMKTDVVVEVAFRLKVVNRQITEAEHIVARITNEAAIANLQTPRPGLLETVPPNQRLPREILLLFVHGYYDAIEQSDGDLVPFADDCVRRENGMHTVGPRPAGAAAPAGGRRGAPAGPPPAGGGGAARAGGARAGGGPGGPGGAGAQTCAGQLDTRFMSYIQSISLRRVWMADPERGLAFGLSMFRHPMDEKTLSKTLTILNPDGTRSQRPMNFNPFDFESAHVIKVRDDTIHEIEAMGVSLPYFSTNGWSDLPR